MKVAINNSLDQSLPFHFLLLLGSHLDYSIYTPVSFPPTSIYPNAHQISFLDLPFEALLLLHHPPVTDKIKSNLLLLAHEALHPPLLADGQTQHHKFGAVSTSVPKITLYLKSHSPTGTQNPV